MAPINDIYNYSCKYESGLKRVTRSKISEKNKTLIRTFDRVCFLEGLSIPRRIKIMGSLMMLGEKYLTTDFDKAAKDDIKDAVLKIESRTDYSYSGIKPIGVMI